jgi:hypothetical protein
MSPAPRTAYIAKNVCINTLSPVLRRLRGPGDLGMDMDAKLHRVQRTLAWFGECLEPVGSSLPGRRILELGRAGRARSLPPSFWPAANRASVSTRRSAFPETSHRPRGSKTSPGCSPTPAATSSVR